MEIEYNSEFSLERNREEFLYKFNNFKEINNFKKCLGIIGSSNIDNLEDIDNFLTDSIKNTFDRVGKYAIVSGGTKGGIPELAIDISKRINLPAIGIFPEDCEKYSLKNLDLCIIIPRPLFGDVTWGCETPVLASISNAVVVNGGEWGTMVEIGTIMKRNKSLLKKEKETVPLILINENKGLTKLLKNDVVKDFPNNNLIYLVDNPNELTEILVRNLNKKND